MVLAHIRVYFITHSLPFANKLLPADKRDQVLILMHIAGQMPECIFFGADREQTEQQLLLLISLRLAKLLSD